MTDTRIVLCDRCGGDGGWDVIENWRHPRPCGEPYSHWDECGACDGRGEVEVVTTLIDLADLDEEVWGIRTAAKVAGLTRQQLDDEMSAGRCAFYEIGGRYLFCRSNLEALK